MWAAAKAAEVDCGSPAGRPARRLAAEEGGIPCCRPKIPSNLIAMQWDVYQDNCEHGTRTTRPCLSGRVVLKISEDCFNFKSEINK